MNTNIDHPTPEALRKLVAEARIIADNLDGSAFVGVQQAADLLPRLADALEPLLDASERVGARDAREAEKRIQGLLGLALLEEQRNENAFEAVNGSIMNRRAMRARTKAAWKAFDDALHAALAAAPQPPGAPEGEWRDIESAPRDGTWFVALCRPYDQWRARIVHFADKYDRFPVSGVQGEMWPTEPTHWQPYRSRRMTDDRGNHE